MVWGCVSYHCKLDLITVKSNLNGQIYRQHILEANVVSHFDNYPLNTRPVLMDDNARPNRAGIMTDQLRYESITTLPRPTRSSYLNPIEPVWDIIGRRVKERTPPVLSLNDLGQTLHQEWQRLTQVRICHLVGSMRRRLATDIRVNGSNIHY